MVGEAAHIHAAAPGGRRYLESMTPDNGLPLPRKERLVSG
jgi:hypothetical protein